MPLLTHPRFPSRRFVAWAFVLLALYLVFVATLLFVAGHFISKYW